MTLPPIDWKRIEEFVGFGREDAPIVFIGMEEGLKKADGLDEDLAIRSTYKAPIMDLKEAHEGDFAASRYSATSAAISAMSMKDHSEPGAHSTMRPNARSIVVTIA